MAATVLHPKDTELACPRCGKRIVCALPTVAAICHDKHRATAMRPVADTTSTESR